MKYLYKGRIFRDYKRRPVQVVKLDNGTLAKFYCGPDATGIIYKDEKGEFIVVGNERRYWKGVIDPLPNDRRLLSLKEFAFFILKPDVEAANLAPLILHHINVRGFEIVAARSLKFTEDLVYRIYPYFFEKMWEKNLLEYFMSGTSHFFIIIGDNVQMDMFLFRNEIREKYRDVHKHPVYNLVHCADNREYALREALCVFDKETLIKKVGLQN